MRALLLQGGISFGLLLAGLLNLLAQLAGIPESCGNPRLWEYIDLQQDPYKEYTQYDQKFGHLVPFHPRPTAGLI